MSTAYESLKRTSRGLRGTLGAELDDPSDRLSKDAEKLLKFHGLYQQKDRDRAPAEAPPKRHVLLARGRIPGGRLTAAQWLAWDDMATRHGDGTLRLTTRQSIELHGVLKRDVRKALQGLHDALQSTRGACGDVVRNVMQPPNPQGRSDLVQLDGVADLLSRHFLARSSAYLELFLDGEPVGAVEPEPLYGEAYLPRKFKIGLTVAGENAIDLFTHDLGLAATFDQAGAIDGWFVFAGGGMGMAFKVAGTFPRLADLLGWVPHSALLAVAEALVGVHRDHGDRADRRHARLKYVVQERGPAWLRTELELRASVQFAQRPLPPWRVPNHLGWIARADGAWSLGLHTLSGRIADTPGRPLRSALRRVVERFRPDLQLTPEQDLLLTGISATDRAAVDAAWAAHGLDLRSPDPLHDRAVACVALPLCGLAITEAERAAPDLLRALQDRLSARGLSERAPSVRIAGCPNGCSRPYAAEVGIVGQRAGHYALFVGGSETGDRLARCVAEQVPLERVPDRLDALFAAWAAQGRPAERLGDFAVRVGFEQTRTWLAG